MRLNSRIVGGVALSLVAALLPGCQSGTTATPPQTEYLTTPSTGTATGFVWDPEAYWWALVNCPDGCAAGIPAEWTWSDVFNQSTVANATVDMYSDDLGQTVTPSTSAPTDSYGVFTTAEFPSGNDIVYPLVTASASTALQHPPPTLPGPPPPASPDVPPAGYLPTKSLRPVQRTPTSCYVPTTPLASDSGVLDAVARFLTFVGQPTTVQDFIDPNKFGGVLVTWTMAPSTFDFLIPADSVTLTSDVGNTVNVTWAPPGALPPPVDVLQSARGFFVDPGGGPTPQYFGISVTLLPPSAGPTEVTLTPTDAVSDDSQRRPWSFPELKMSVAPGVVSYRVFHASPLPGNLAFEGPGNLVGDSPPSNLQCYPDGASD